MRSRARHSALTVGCAFGGPETQQPSQRRSALPALLLTRHALAAHGYCVRAQPTAGLTFLIDGVPQGALRSGTTGTKSETWPITGKGVHSLQVSAQPQPQPQPSHVTAHRMPCIISQ